MRILRIEKDEPPRRRRRLAAVSLFLAAMFCGAATYGAVYDVLAWRGAAEGARQQALDQHLDARLRTHGIVGALSDARLTIRVLRQIAEEGGDVGKQASAALVQIEKALR